MSKGLGDSIEKITEWTGLKKLVKSIFGEDCGCDERKQKLNQMFPNFKNIRAFTNDEKIIFENVLPEIERSNLLTPENKTILSGLYKAIFKEEPSFSSCGSCNIKIVNNLKKIYSKSCIK